MWSKPDVYKNILHQLRVRPDDFELYDSMLDVRASSVKIYYDFNCLYVVDIFQVNQCNKKGKVSKMSAYFLTFWSCFGLVNNYDMLSRTFIMINFDHAVHIQKRMLKG